MAFGAALVAAVWWQRATIGAAIGEMGSMSAAVVVVLILLAILERLIRADILRRLLGATTLGRALTIHDVGSAASKGIPLGGPVATALRWSIANDAAVPTTRFASSMVGYGVATTFVTWMLPVTVLVIELMTRPATTTDMAMLAVCVVVLGGSIVFWAVVLNSARVTLWMRSVVRRSHRIVARFMPSAHDHDPEAGLMEVRSALRQIGRRPVGLLVRTAVAQACGAVILLIALRGLGVGSELGAIEFARVYFVVTLLSSFVPVPGGVGVVEAGLTGALVAAGVDPTTALAGVLVYRLLTYVAPIVVGAVLYACWRFGVRRRRTVASVSTVAPQPVA